MTTEETGTDPQPNWRNASSYAYTRNLMREDWAWEFLRRNLAYADVAAKIQAAASQFLRELPNICVIDSSSTGDAGLVWGLLFLRSAEPPVWSCFRVLAGRCESGRASCRSEPHLLE